MSDRQNQVAHRAALVLSSQADCPIVSGEQGHWVDPAGTINYRKPDGSDVAILIKMKYLLATAGRVHMSADTDFVFDSLNDNGLSVVLPSDATLAQACIYAEALKQSQIDHYDDIGTVSVDGAHLAADPVNKAALQGIASLDGTNLTLLCDLITALDTARFNHASAVDASVSDPITGDPIHSHFHDDLAENNASMSTSPIDLPSAIICLNDLRVIFIAHFGRASE